MKRFPIILIPVLLCWLPFGFAQTPTAVAEKQDPLKDSIDKYEKAQLWAKVLSFAEQWEAKLKKEKKESTADYGKALSSLGNALNQTGKSQDAEPILLQSLEIRKKALGEDHPDVAKTINNLGILYYLLGNYPKSETYFLQALEIRKKILGENHPDVAATLNNLGVLYSDMGDYLKAEPNYLKALEIRKNTLVKNHPDLAASLNNIGVLYMEMGSYPKAEPYYIQALEIRKKAFGENHPSVAQSLDNLGGLYYKMGSYPKAEPYYLQALEFRKKAHGDNHRNVASSLNNLGTLYGDMGNYSKAELYYYQALEIRKKVLTENHPDIAALFNNLGTLYNDMNNYPKAELFLLQALEIKKKVLEENHPDLAASLNNLGVLYDFMGNYPKAEPYYLQALEIRKKALGEYHPDVGGALNNLGNLLKGMGNYPKAEPYYLQALEIFKKTLGENHPDVATSLNNLGTLYFDMGNYSKAETYYQKAFEIYKIALDENHPDKVALISSFGQLNFSRGQMEKAQIFYLDWNAKNKAQIQRYFPFLSDNEKKRFYENRFSYKQEMFKSFCVNQYVAKKDIGSDLYNNQLSTKSLLLSNSKKFKQRLRTTKDSSVLSKFETWEGITNRIAKLYSSTDSSELVKLKQLETEAETLEKELVRKSEDFATLADKKVYKWTDVQKKLKPGEAAIEMVRVRKYGISKIVTDTSDPKKPTYKVKGLTDTAYYAALIVKPTSKYPEMVLLKSGNALEERWIQVYKNSMSKRIPDQTSYNQFWKKIDAKLGPAVKRVYFSPDGVYNSINLNTLQNPKTGKYLLDERDIRLVTNTKDIVTASISKPNPAYACLVGFPDYNTDKDKRAAVFQKERNHPEAWYNLNLTRGDAFGELPATKTEIENISGLMQSNGWQVESLLGENALEESIKAVQKPRVLHIATHGFFQPDTTKGSNPLIHSGLLLTGANKTLAGEKDDKVDDGILTAYEAMNLNLDNTDLVVLSACETGLGEIKNGEGVYGLQRAFKVAGAKTIIMSLWKVSDVATQELMVSFYKHWLGSASDNSLLSPPQNRRAAFLAAQKELKAKYPSPYYWGAFVMVGE